MRKLNLEIDLKNVQNTRETLERFNQSLRLRYSSGPVTAISWDSFDDLLWDINSHSEAIQEVNARTVHLIVNNISDIKDYSEEDFNTLCEILIYSTMNTRFQGKFEFSFEIGIDKHMPNGLLN